MKKLYILLLPVFLTSCLGYKMSRIYEPSIQKSRFTNLQVRIDSASFEHAMFQDRLKIDFVTENKETNSVLYCFNYYKPSNYPTKMRTFYGSPTYENSSILDLPNFEKKYKHFLIDDDTLLIYNGLKGVEDYISKTNNSRNKVTGSGSGSKIGNDNSLVSIVPILKYPKTFTNSMVNPAPSGGYYYSKPIVTYGDFAGTMASAITSSVFAAMEERDEILSKHEIGGNITSAERNKVMFLIYTFNCDALPTITDSYKLISNFTNNEIADLSATNSEKPAGYIDFRIVDKEFQSGSAFWLTSSTLLLCIPNLVGYPISSQKINLTLEATIYNSDNKKIKTYTSNGEGKAFSALYWGYSATGSAYMWMPNSTSRTANSKALYSSLSELLRQIRKDKNEIEKLLNDNPD